MEQQNYLSNEEIHLVEPNNINDLIDALSIKTILQKRVKSLKSAQDCTQLRALLKLQEMYIQKYIDSLGSFSNKRLKNNLTYLIKRNNIGIGELEKFLGLSTGYISRAVNEDSKKRICIDNVCKIANLFGVDVRTLLETDMSVQNTNTELVADFVEKLTRQTKTNEINWLQDGGIDSGISDEFISLGLVEKRNNELVYCPHHLNSINKWVIASDVFSCFDINKQMKLMIIPFKLDKSETVHYDFIFIKKHKEEVAEDNWEKVFTTIDDCTGRLDMCAYFLYVSIHNQEFDAKVSTSAKKLISEYMK